MKIHEVQENLRNTIAGKEAYLQVLSEKADVAVYPKNKAYEAMVEMLEVNIDELKRILVDVDKAVEQYNELGWALNPERMGQ